MSKVITEIDSKVNEFFIKTKVTQKFSNTTENPLELKIYVFKVEGIIFSSFNCQIGDSIKVKSKVIKKEKAEIKYTDSIASGNAAIFVSHDPTNENRIIINMGNIPAKTDVIFISEFIQSIETSQSYEFELFRNLPIFQGKDNEIFYNSELNGRIDIKTKVEIINIKKNILMKDLKIIEEKYQNEKKNEYLINYKIDELPTFSWYNNLDYIPSSKIYFDLNINEPLALIQNSSIEPKEINYFIQYKYKKDKLNNEDEIVNKPALFIFLVDESGSMYDSIKIAIKALQLFMQSLPVGSYYQIIGFGTSFEKYDKIPKEYNKENIKESLKIIEKLNSDLGGTNIYDPLKDIYNSSEIYDKINLPRNIFLLTDGEINDKKETLALIEKNNLKFKIYSIGIGNSFDEDLIKNAGIIGKGNYNFCKNLDNLNSIIASEINAATSPYINNIKIKTNLEDKNIIKNKEIPNVLRNNEIIKLYYIINDTNIDKIKIEINYIDTEDNKNITKNYEIIPEKIEKGEELSKLIMNNYIMNNKDLTKDKKLNLALKYQIFTEDTSLFAELEFSEKITEEMKLKVLGDKENNVIKQIKKPEPEYNIDYNECCCCKDACYDDDDDDEMFASYDDDEDNCLDCDDDDGDYRGGRSYNYKNYKSSYKEEIKEKKEKENKSLESKEFELNNKDNIMKMINTQDFIEGYWEENEYTKIVKEKYKKEYEILKGLTDKNIDDKTAMTILIIYFINKEHSELLNDLIMIIKKANLYIQKITKDKYENIIKKLIS